MKLIKAIIAILFLVLICTNSIPVQAVPSTPHITNPSPYCGDEEVTITIKGVQTCVNITVDAGCTVNISFLWYNWTDWPDTPPRYESYGEYINVSASGQFCAWDNNVSCSVENDWFTEWHWWRVVANFTCPGGNTYTEIFYCYYTPETCVLSAIWPPTNETGLCPCCIPICTNVTNKAGALMNITVYSNLSTGIWDYFWLGADKNVTFSNVTNGSYCFNVPFFLLYNYTYYWNVSIDDGTSTYNSDTFWFTTESNVLNCTQCSNHTDTYTDTIRDDAWLVGLILVFSTLGILAFVKQRRI